MSTSVGLTVLGLREHLRWSAKRAGSVRALGRLWGFSHSFLYEVLNGERPPSPRLLCMMGFKKETTYVKVSR